MKTRAERERYFIREDSTILLKVNRSHVITNVRLDKIPSFDTMENRAIIIINHFIAPRNHYEYGDKSVHLNFSQLCFHIF